MNCPYNNNFYVREFEVLQGLPGAPSSIVVLLCFTVENPDFKDLGEFQQVDAIPDLKRLQNWRYMNATSPAPSNRTDREIGLIKQSWALGQHCIYPDTLNENYWVYQEFVSDTLATRAILAEIARFTQPARQRVTSSLLANTFIKHLKALETLRQL